MTQREEESLLEEMREAIRGDRERAASRASRPPEARAQERPAAPESRQTETLPTVPSNGFLRRLLGHR